MKVTYGNEPKKIEEPTYPYFGVTHAEDGRFVVMFTSPRTGMVVQSENKEIPLYEYGCSGYVPWIESEFKKLENFSVTFSVP